MDIGGKAKCTQPSCEPFPLNFPPNGQLIRVAQAASDTHPHAAVDIYRQLEDEPAWTNFIARLREHRRRLPALRKELSESGL